VDVALAEKGFVRGRGGPVAGLVGGWVINDDSGQAFYSGGSGGFFAAQFFIF
jgi:hypothetical protein